MWYGKFTSHGWLLHLDPLSLSVPQFTPYESSWSLRQKTQYQSGSAWSNQQFVNITIMITHITPPEWTVLYIYIYTRIIMYLYMLLCDTWTMIASCESIGSPWRHQQGDAFLCWSQEGGEIPTAHASGSQRRPGMRCRKWALHSLVIHGFSIMLGPEWGKS
jgi:hypothetical protein